MTKFAIASALVLLLSISSSFSFRLSITRRPLLKGNRQCSMLAEHLSLLDHSLITSSLDAVQHAVSSAMHHDVQSMHTTFNIAADELTVPVPDVQASTGLYKVDKTGFIGTIGDVFEQAIDFLHNVAGKGSYGLAIVFFTMLIKAGTLPLTIKQLESTTKMQKLQPLQAKINAKFPRKEDEQRKNQMMAQLFQAANVNPLAGCFPALVQIPVFISLYRALQNLIAENKLSEPFLWIPDLEGPTYTSSAGEAAAWWQSIPGALLTGGTPTLGWDDTLKFLSIPLILWCSQTLSTKVLTPPRDPNKILTEQEQFSQGLVNNLPFIVAFFSLNVPAGLGLYWITNNILTTLITLTVKASLKDDVMPPEVDQMMVALNAPSSFGAPKRAPQASSRQMMKSSIVDESKMVSGFGASTAPKTIDVQAVVEADEVARASATDASLDTPATVPANDWRNIAEERKARAAEGEALGPLGKLFQMTGQKMVIDNVVDENVTAGSSSSEEGMIEGGAVETMSTDSQSADETARKRKKREKPAAKKAKGK